MMMYGFRMIGGGEGKREFENDKKRKKDK